MFATTADDVRRQAGILSRKLSEFPETNLPVTYINTMMPRGTARQQFSLAHRILDLDIPTHLDEDDLSAAREKLGFVKCIMWMGGACTMAWADRIGVTPGHYYYDGPSPQPPG